jgi:hypothetical protein
MKPEEPVAVLRHALQRHGGRWHRQRVKLDRRPGDQRQLDDADVLRAGDPQAGQRSRDNRLRNGDTNRAPQQACAPCFVATEPSAGPEGEPRVVATRVGPIGVSNRC